MPTKGETLDWTLGPLARQMREKTGARFALFFYISDSYAGPGRVALIMTMGLLFGVPVEGGTQAGFASLVDLETGDVVWFNRLERKTGDLRTPEAAAGTIDVLLQEFPREKICGACKKTGAPSA